ncbi:MAG: hypothetical protein WBO08_17645 [Mycobacterium sp.]|nr:hypothetical protein [Mycobacterium sp.]
MIARLLTTLLLLISVSGCQLFGPDPQATSLPAVFGARITDGQLKLWTGTPCGKVSRVVVQFTPDGGRLTLEPAQGQIAEIEFLTVGGPYPTLDVVEQLPDDFDWRTARDVTLIVDSPQDIGATPTSVAEIVANSADHPEDTYYFQGIGWRNAAQIAEENRRSLLTVCTADPATEPSLPSALGARVTDGTLRVFTGTPCTGTNGVTLAFTSGGATQGEITTSMFAPAGSPVDIDRLTVGTPPDGMQVKTALPAEFDWGTMQSVSLRVHRPELSREATVSLREVVDGSPEHPADSYYFDGIGWLDPAAVADQDGRTFLGPCTVDPAR